MVIFYYTYVILCWMIISMTLKDSNMDPVVPFYHLDDTSFNAAIYEFAHGPLNFDLINLESLLFNPLEKITSDFALFNSVDPDTNFSFFSSPAKYVIESEVNILTDSSKFESTFSLLLGCLWANPVQVCVLFVCFLFFLFFSFFFFFRVGKSFACHSPGKWCLCA